MQLKRCFTTLALIVSLLSSATEDPKVIPSDLKTVTVYRSGAELTHNTSTQLGQGNSELIIEGISNSVDMNSVQINCPAAVTILSVEFGTNYLVLPEVSARIKLLQDSAEHVQKDLDRIAVQITTTTDLLEVLKANRDIKGQQTGLSVAELIKLMDYYKIKSSELQNDLAFLRERQRKLAEQVNKIRNADHGRKKAGTPATGDS
jgi:prefoldin subunit 5